MGGLGGRSGNNRDTGITVGVQRSGIFGLRSIEREIHEPPYPEPRGDLALVAGTTITIEPGIYLPGRFGVRLEDTVVVTEEGGVPVDPDPPMGMEQ